MSGSLIKAIAVLVCTFAVGLLSGVYWERWHRTGVEQTSDSGPFGAGEGVSGPELHAAAMTSLQDSLGLDQVQMEEIHRVFLRNQEVIQQSWEAMRPSLNEAMIQIHAEVNSVLSEGQQERFHEWLERHGHSGRNHGRHFLH